MKPMTDGYNVGTFVQDMVKAEHEKDLWGIIKAARNFFPKAEELEAEYFQLLKEELSNGKASRGIAEVTEPLHLPGHKTLSMRLIPD